MTLERDDDENGLAFPWLLLALPGAVVLRAAVAPQAAPVPLVVPPPAPAPSPTAVRASFEPPPVRTRPGFEPHVAPVVPDLPEILRPLPVFGPVQEPVFAPVPSRQPAPTTRMEAAVREVAVAAVAQDAAKKASARFEARTQDLKLKTPAAAQAAVQSAAKQLQTDVAKAPGVRNVAQVEQRVRAEVRRLEKAGVSPAEIERRAKKKIREMRRDAGRKVEKAIAPVQKAVDKLPAPVRRAGSAALAPVKREAELILKRATAPIKRDVIKAGEALLAPIRQAATQAVQQLGVGPATKLFTDQIKKMGLPSIPVVLPTDLSPTGVLNAAYNSGKNFVQERFAHATGVPLPLPNAVSVKAIKKWADDMVPDDARQAIEMGIDIGLSATTSAVSSILAGAIAGSAIPGLGTVIGIGVALGVSVLKGLVKEALTEKHGFQQMCKADDVVQNLRNKYLGPGYLQKSVSARAAAVKAFNKEMAALAPKLSPLEQIPWIAKKLSDSSKAVAEEQRKTKCGLTPYRTGLRTQGKYAFDVAKVTVPVLGLLQLDKLIPLYDKAPKQAFFWDTGRVQPGGRIVGGTGKVLFGASATGNDIGTLLTLMQARRAQLQTLVAQASRVEKLAPNEIAPLRWNLVTEIRNATAQYQLDPSPQTEAWLKMLMGFLGRLVRVDAAAVERMRTSVAYQRQREAELQKQGKTGVVTGII